MGNFVGLSQHNAKFVRLPRDPAVTDESSVKNTLIQVFYESKAHSLEKLPGAQSSQDLLK